MIDMTGLALVLCYLIAELVVFSASVLTFRETTLCKPYPISAHCRETTITASELTIAAPHQDEDKGGPSELSRFDKNVTTESDGKSSNNNVLNKAVS